MSTFGTILSFVVIGAIIFYIGFNVGANAEFAKNCDYEEKYEIEKRKRKYYQMMAENPTKILEVKVIGGNDVKDSTFKE
jgi:hypothetical protein